MAFLACTMYVFIFIHRFYSVLVRYNLVVQVNVKK